MMRSLLVFVLMCCVAAAAAAVPLDLNNADGIAAMFVIGHNSQLGGVYVVCTDGAGYYFQGGGTTWQTFTASPVPLSQVADWTPFMLYTTDGRWFFQYAADQNNSHWQQMGTAGQPEAPPCSAPVRNSLESLGGVKSQFR
jgi:hypothetical protein